MDQNADKRLALITSELARVSIQNSIKIVCAESCTGGGVAYALTAIPGSSEWFERGFVTYSNSSKIEMLGVDDKSIQEYGAVSAQVAEQMAKGALLHSAGDVSISITGIAGPKGGNEQKSVGTCYFGLASRKHEFYCKHEKFQGDRAAIRSQAILFSIRELLLFVEKNYASPL